MEVAFGGLSAAHQRLGAKMRCAPSPGLPGQKKNRKGFTAFSLVGA